MSRDNKKDSEMMTHQLLSVSPIQPTSDTSEFWRGLYDRSSGTARNEPSHGSIMSSVMEGGLSILTELRLAPSRTLHSEALVKSSPMSSSVRSMLEAREFGRRFDAIPLDVASIEDRLPPLECPEGPVEFLASDVSLEDLSLSVDGLLQHRKRLISRTIDQKRPRRHVFVLGAGPAGLMAAVQLSLRDHHVVVCEHREVYSRNRYIGVYKDVTYLMAALGMPESMTYDFSQYRGKRGIMLADIQTLLHGIALKLGVVIYTGAVPRRLDLQALHDGEVELQRATRAGPNSPSSVGVTRWRHDSVSRVASGTPIRFDTIVEATGGRSGLRETLVGKENVVSIHDIGMAAAKDDPSLRSCFDDPEDHTAEYVESDYGCPAGLLPKFAATLHSGDKSEIPDEIPCFVSNIDASVFTAPIRPSDGSLGLASRIRGRDLTIPHDWVVLECRLSDQSRSRYHVEGPLPQSFEFGGRRVQTRDALDKLNPVGLLVRILYAMGVPFDAVDRRQLVEFYSAESSYGDASDIVSTWIGRFRGVRVGAGTKPIWRGFVPGSEIIEYGLIGESLQNAWYRFGVGVDDSFMGATYFATGLELGVDACAEEACRLERVMRSRSVQILYHLYEVALNKDQGIVGSVLTDYYMEEQHTEDLAEARLREAAKEGGEILAAEADICSGTSDPLLAAALDYSLEACCRRVVHLLGSFSYEPSMLVNLQPTANLERADWRAEALQVLQSILSEHHRALVLPLFQKSDGKRKAVIPRLMQERLVELSSGRYQWVTPWVRACALRVLDPSTATAIATLTAAASDPDPLIAEIATRTLQGGRNHGEILAQARTSTIDKAVLLKRVTIFESIPYSVLGSIAPLLTERWLVAGERIFDKGDLGDSLYVIGSGRVRVHDGELTLREMSKDEFFGELSLLDSEPRSASAMAVDRTLLFRLAQKDFYSLVSEQPLITRAINRALCRMIRNS
jgi:Cyclic nucleotide-binding domain/HI0933-like protein